MSVVVDEQPLAAEDLGLKTVGQVLAHLKRDNRLIVQVLIDGQEPDLRRFRALKKSPLAGHTVFIETADPRQMAHDVLDEVEAQLSEADRLKGESATLLQRNQVGPAIERLGGCFSAWQHAQESVLKIAQLRRIDPQSITVHGRAFTELLAEFTSHLRQIRDALEGRDFAALTDILAHKMSRAVEQWREALRYFRGAICF
ncbi:MAG: hypothetical protein QOF78_1859 [Phycisphaerales bacterium]|jgi:hypothetical protein|nr:hypothetical protein [Phycisphaerales bacterium]